MSAAASARAAALRAKVAELERVEADVNMTKSPEEIERERIHQLDETASYARWPRKYEEDWRKRATPFFSDPYPPAEEIQLRVRNKPLYKVDKNSLIDRYRGVIEVVHGNQTVVLGYVGLRYDNEHKELEGDGFYNLTQITEGGKAMARILLKQYNVKLRNMIPVVLYAMLRDLPLGKRKGEALSIYASGATRDNRDYFGTQVDLIRYYQYMGFEPLSGPTLTSRYPIRSRTTHIKEKGGYDMYAGSIPELMERLHSISVASWHIHKLEGKFWQLDVVGPQTFSWIGSKSTRKYRILSPAAGLVPRVVRPQTPEEQERDFPDIEVVTKLMKELNTDLSTDDLRMLLGSCLGTIKNDQIKKKRKTTGARLVY